MQSENQNLEYKENFSDEVIKTIVAMSNASGGKVIVGVKDNQNVSGIELNKENRANWLNQIKNKTYPYVLPIVTIEKRNNKNIAIFTVKESPFKPISFKNRYYLRRNNSNQILSFSDSFILYLETQHLSWDKIIDQKLKISDLSEAKILKFVEKVKNNGFYSQDDPLNVLKKMQLITDGGITYAAKLLFWPESFKDYYIHLVKFLRDDSREEVIEDLYLRVDPISQVEKIMVFFKRNIRQSIKKNPAEVKLTHDIIWEYPLDAIRELIINLIVHRNYQDSSPSLIFIYNHKIEMWNAGKLPADITLKNIKSNNYASHLRNHLLTQAFQKVNIIQNLGSGLNKINQMFNKQSIKFNIEKHNNGTRIVLSKSQNLSKKGSEKSSEKSSEKILRLLKKDSKLSARQLAVFLEISDRAVEKNISNLKASGKLTRIGSAKGGRWKVLKK